MNVLDSTHLRCKVYKNAIGFSRLWNFLKVAVWLPPKSFPKRSKTPNCAIRVTPRYTLLVQPIVCSGEVQKKIKSTKQIRWEKFGRRHDRSCWQVSVVKTIWVPHNTCVHFHYSISTLTNTLTVHMLPVSTPRAKWHACSRSSDWLQVHNERIFYCHSLKIRINFFNL